MFIGMGHDNPAVTPAAELRYDACITVAEDYEPKAPVALQTIEGGDHAVIKNCPVAKIKDAFGHLYGKWLARSGRELRPGAGLFGVRGRPGRARGQETAGEYSYAVAAEAAAREPSEANEHRSDDAGTAAGRLSAACGALQRGLSGMDGF